MFEFDLEKSINVKINIGESGTVDELRELEVLFFKDLDLENYQDQLGTFVQSEIRSDQPLTMFELQKVDDFTRRFFSKRLTEAETWIVRGFVIGKLLEERERIPMKPKIEIGKLPYAVRQAAIEKKLNIREIRALEWANAHAGQHMASVTNETINRVRGIVFDNIRNGRGPRDLRNTLETEFLTDNGESNRNWKKVAIQETNNSFNQGYLAQLTGGEWLFGLSMPDRCPHCGKLIDGKVYPLLADSVAKDYANLDPESEDYKKWAYVWENAVWLSKDNMHRSGSPRKQKMVGAGNSPDNLEDRAHHEMFMPCIPLHIYCRCRWVRINPLLQYVENGEMKMKVQDKEAWQKWYDRFVLPTVERFAKLHIDISRKVQP